MDTNLTLLLAAGVAASMIWHKRTGLASGGIVSPGVLAMTMGDARRVLAGLAVGLAVALILRLLKRYEPLFGRERTGAAMLLALLIRFAAGGATADPLWFGWVVPGLIGADIERQGALPTLTSLFITSFAAIFAAVLIQALSGCVSQWI